MIGTESTMATPRKPIWPLSATSTRNSTTTATRAVNRPASASQPDDAT